MPLTPSIPVVDGQRTARRVVLGRQLGAAGTEGVVWMSQDGRSAVKLFSEETLRNLPDDFLPAAEAQWGSRHLLGRAVAFVEELVVDPATGRVVGVLMELKPGVTLSSAFDHTTPLVVVVRSLREWARKAQIIEDTMGTITPWYAGDRKPDNCLVLVSRRGHPSVWEVDATSYFPAVVRDQYGQSVQAQPLTNGTPGYLRGARVLDPELWFDEQDGRYGLACGCYELLTGGSHPTLPANCNTTPYDPDQFAGKGIYPRYTPHLAAPPKKIADLVWPAEVDRLFRQAFLTAVAPEPNEFEAAFDAWAQSLARRPSWWVWVAKRQLPSWPRLPRLGKLFGRFERYVLKKALRGLGQVGAGLQALVTTSAAVWFIMFASTGVGYVAWEHAQVPVAPQSVPAAPPTLPPPTPPPPVPEQFDPSVIYSGVPDVRRRSPQPSRPDRR